MRRVVVLGGGFGGIATAVALRGRLESGDEVVLVERRPTFVMGLRKNWALTGAASLAAGERELASLERRGIRVRQATVEAIDPGARTVTVDAERLEADVLVVALGAERDPDAIPGFRDHAIDVYDPAASAAGAAAIDAFAGGRLVVGVFGVPYPCPPAPFELALLLAERLDRDATPGGVSVFTPQPGSLPILGTDGCASFDGRLAAAGITFRPKTQAVAVEPGAVRTADGVRIPFDLLLGVPPHRAPRVVVEAGLTGPGGWVAVDRHTLETRFAGVYAIGDVTAIPLANGMALPKAGVFAHAAGEVVASRIADAFAGLAPTATFEGRGQCFLETGHGAATVVAGDFFADPPAVALGDDSADNLDAKRRFEGDRLTAWFGG
ncbi:MAG TPA: FAD/NAD(P)-binding oxidoreductase [Candidatus Limnocylindrales bacterium]|nr:FAD/NAD(P)-binding oxidoreductase [Candidatus Limnocylindrales bacterium]